MLSDEVIDRVMERLIRRIEKVNTYTLKQIAKTIKKMGTLAPTDTQITDTTLISQLNAIEKAYSYDTQTNISQDNHDLPFIITAEAILSLKNILNI